MGEAIRTCPEYVAFFLAYHIFIVYMAVMFLIGLRK